MSFSFVDYCKRTRSGLIPFLRLRRHLTTGTVAILLFFGFALVSIVRGKEPDRSERTDDQSELHRGFLEVYSATDKFNDGDAWYFPHSAYTIYTPGRKGFKNVENHISRSDEIPEVVFLPAGSYTVAARAERGYVRVPVVIWEGQLTTLHLDVWEDQTLRRFVHN